jgi:tetratricopeptide (TPR) repeat protein
VKNNPQNAYLKNDLGILYSGEGRFDAAEKSFLSALAIQPENDYFYFSLAEMYAMADKLDQAQEALEKAIGFNEKFADAYFNLAVVFYVSGKKDAAKENLDKAVQCWREEGKIFEAGSAVESFMIFMFDQEDRLKDISAEALLNEISVK